MTKRPSSSSGSKPKKTKQNYDLHVCQNKEDEMCLSGNFHQGSDIFADWTRGRQCVANALVSILFKYISEKEVKEWNPQDINSILLYGDKLYQHVRQDSDHIYLHPFDLPSHFCFENTLMRCSVTSTYSGNLSESFEENGPFLSLESAVSLCFYSSAHAGIFICKDTAVSILYSEPNFFVFDPHARDSSGKPSIGGNAVIISVSSFPGVNKLIRRLFNCQESVQFDLYQMSINTFTSPDYFRRQEKNVCLSKFRSCSLNLEICDSCGLVAHDKNMESLNCGDFCSDEHSELLNGHGNNFIAKFHKSVESGPDYVCKCCTQTWFKESVRTASNISSSVLHKCLIEENDLVCTTCYKHLRENKVPPCSKTNSLNFPPKPPELELTSLEERLVAPRIPFMQIREKPRGGQLSITGNVVNVPADVMSTVNKLPRLLTEDETIALKFKRNLNFKHSVAFERIRPNKVMNAAKWLVQNSDLFKSEGIELNDGWFPDYSMVENDESDVSEDIGTDNSKTDVATEWIEENIDERATGNTDTVMQPVDFREFNEVLNVAPGEHSSPISLFKDVNSEFLAFPAIYCGQTRPDNKDRIIPLHYSTICKWELRNVDRRCATCVPNIFFKLKKLQIKQIQDKVSLAVRKCKLKGKKYTVAQILDSCTADSIVKLNEGYHVLRKLRGSPPYWETAKKDIFGMIRQLGLPTWFCSFSAAETKWTPLLITLGKLVDKVAYSEDDVLKLSWEEKCKLIKADPVTCARYFDYRFQRFFHQVLNHPTQPIGEVVDFFYRIEFQQRGSPHVHMLLWIKNAPTAESNSNEEISHFVDKYMTCKKDLVDSYLINYQTHRHARTCMKKNKPVCRFNFPIPPMPCTTVLCPLEEKDFLADAKKDYQRVCTFLDSAENKEKNLTFDEFLCKVDMNLEKYILAVRSSINQQKIFLQRNPNESRINVYNCILLQSWQANIDIQFILDAYACAAYIVSYVSKGQRGMSNLLHRACEEAKRTDSDIRQQVRRIGNQFLTHVEVGAQEAAYLVLQMPLRRTSRSFIFINTSPPEERVVMLKPKHILEEMKDDRTDIESNNIIRVYQQRPKVIESICLADFVAKFSVKYKKKEKENENHRVNDLLETEYVEDTSDDVICPSEEDILQHTYVFKNGIEIVQRKKLCVLRWVHFDVETESEKFYRELLMLFTYWRNEEKDLIKNFNSFEESYMTRRSFIEKKRAEYENNKELLHDIEQACLNNTSDEISLSVAPECEHQEEIDRNLGETLSEQYGCFDPGRNAPVYDVGLDLGITRKQVEDVTQWGELDDIAYRRMLRELNEQQKKFMYHILHKLKTSSEPVYAFLSGGAGVGKSVVTRALYQALLKYFSHKLQNSPDNLHVLLCAPTGKAAHNINGSTIHSAFCIPVGQGFKYKPLDMQQLSSFRTRYMHLKVIFIDEISMVGSGMFNFINLRMQEITGVRTPFGGTSIIAVGDLFQLKPVMDRWIFSPSNVDYGSIASNLWTDNFKLFELTQIMRQKDDKIFAELLNRFREGYHTDQDVEELKKRITPDLPEFKAIPHLFTTRKEVEAFNNLVFDTAEADLKIVIDAIDWVIGSKNTDLNAKILSRVPDDSTRTMGLASSLKLVMGVPAEITNNVSVQDGVTNGSSCIIKHFEYLVQGSNRVSIIWVKFEEERIGQQLRIEHARFFHSNIEKSWTPILEITRILKVQFNGTYQVKRRQFPLQLAAAKTIHKAQGSTIQSAILHCGKRKMDHIHYVGLSRITSMDKLHILDLNETKISVSVAVLEEMNRLRNQAKISLSYEHFDYHVAASVRIVFHNIRSLHRHFEDLEKDFNLLLANIIVVCETRLTEYDQNEIYALTNFILHRFDFPCQDTQRPIYGFALYVRNGVSIQSIRKNIYGHTQVLTVDIARGQEWITLKCLHFPPKTTLSCAQEVLVQCLCTDFSGKPVVLMGDFNIDIQTNRSLQSFLYDNFGLRYLSTGITTDYDTIIDHIYTNISFPEISSWGTLETYYSDHKPLFLSLK